jgi:hypothetical protein
MDEYWEALTSRVKSAETFILGNDPRTATVSNAEISSQLKKASMQGESAGRDLDDISRHPPIVKPYVPAHFTPDQLRYIIEDGRVAFKHLILMSTVTFIVGLLLVVLAGIAGLIVHSNVLALIFGLLGVGVLLTIMFIKPQEKIQVALANMIQAQAIYLDLSNQFQIWGPAARSATTIEERQQASDALHNATMFSLKAINEYIEPRTNLK